jgi:hypothetical protein
LSKDSSTEVHRPMMNHRGQVPGSKPPIENEIVYPNRTEESLDKTEPTKPDPARGAGQ